MARPWRIEYGGALHHVLSRGDRREVIVRGHSDREDFLEALARTCGKTGWEIHAYCLMTNHFHLVVETPRPNLSIGMQWLLGTYTQRFNRRHTVSGHLFGGRFKALLVDERDPFYLREVCDYVHLNPARANIVAREAPLERYRWSSYPSYLMAPKRRPAWLCTDRLLGEHGIAADTASGRRELSRRTETRRRESMSPETMKQIERGWKLGGEDFLDAIMDKIELRPKEGHPGRQREETEEQKAERLLARALRELGWTAGELNKRRKGDPAKVALARGLREQTAVSLKWIAQRLKMGTWTHVSNRLYHSSDEV